MTLFDALRYDAVVLLASVAGAAVTFSTDQVGRT